MITLRSGSVAWQFTRSSYFSFPVDCCDPDDVFELAVEAGADDIDFDEETIEIFGPVEVFKEVSDRLKEAEITPEEAELRMIPNNTMVLPPGETMQVVKVIDALEDLEDVQNVYSTLIISDEAMAQLQAV